MREFVYEDDRDGRLWKVGWPKFRVETPKLLEERVAELIAERKIVGVFWGRSEFGPRALGNRSILADPRWDGMRDYLNDRVKHRQWFRPFAPMVLEEKCAEYFDLNVPSPHMLLVADVLEDKRSVIPAVTHVDGTARVQTVNAADNPRQYKVVKAFEAITGVPVVLNTSFNDHGEPIVETPLDAFECFAGTELDVLVLGKHILHKEIPVEGTA